MAKNHAGDTERATFVRHGKLRRSSSWRNAIRVLATTLLVVALSGVATVAYAVWGLVQNVQTVDLGETNDVDAVEAGSQSIDGALTVLLVGSDSRQGQEYDDGEEGELNDVTLMLHVAEDHKSATVVSFPRDLMIPIPSCPGPNGEENYYSAMSEQQLNSTLSYGGLPCTVRTIEALTDMEIPYGGLVTFDGVIGMSNAIGGVDVCLAQPIVDPATDLDLPAGDNTLVGMEALQFLRTRHGVGDGGDTSRISNQQVFMSALVRKLKSAETLSDPVKVYGLAKAAVENMTLSSNMASVQFMQQVAATVQDIDLERINFVQYPTFSHPYEEGRLTPDYASAEVLFDVLEQGESFTVQSTGQGANAGSAAESGDAGDAGADGGTGETTEPADGAEDADAGADGADSEADAGGSGTLLPENITGQAADNVTCSAGRTVF